MLSRLVTRTSPMRIISRVSLKGVDGAPITTSRQLLSNNVSNVGSIMHDTFFKFSTGIPLAIRAGVNVIIACGMCYVIVPKSKRNPAPDNQNHPSNTEYMYFGAFGVIVSVIPWIISLPLAGAITWLKKNNNH
jgi:hypothetical protein